MPVEVQTPGGNISRLVTNYPHLHVEECDGTEPLESYAALRRAVEHCRARKGPALVHAHVTRPYSHSLSDDEKLYKCEAERSAEAQRDPLPKFAVFLVREGILDESEIEALEAEVDKEIVEATDRALAAELPARESIYKWVYSPDIDPDVARFRSHAEKRRPSENDGGDGFRHAAGRNGARRARCGVWRGRGGLQPRREFDDGEREGRRIQGDRRACSGNSGRSAFSIRRWRKRISWGVSIGMAIRGLKPVPEIQFFDYIWPAMMQLRNELATMRWRSGGHFKSPVVIRVAIGGYLTGGAIYHSQCGEVTFTHIPGLRVVMPSTALDVCGLLRTAIRSDDPVLFLEHKHLYRQPYNRSEYPGAGFHDSVWQGAHGARRHGREHHHVWRGGASRGSGGGGAIARRHFRGDCRSAVAESLRLGGDCGDACARPIA